ncbi:MAG: hypothetical protein ACU0DH_09620 [Paracoccus sp. (in: a-proteobacteria)]|uniref:hypothetical protein n=1 Tax=Paracoccus sp. TaxID=267 RepID=UPI0040599140
MGLFSSPQRAIKAVLVSQVLMAGAIVGLDVVRAPGSAVPGLYAPPAEGPGVRPYRPDLRPTDPTRPGAPAMRQMPQTLEFAETEDMIEIIGQIAPGDADRFVAWLDRARPQARLVALDSSGGSVADALAIGRTIRGAGYATRVADGAVCLSACPYIFAGGLDRQVEQGGVIGVHQHYFGQNTVLPAFMAVGDLQRAQAGVMEFLVEMGVDLRLMTHALRIPPSEINILSPDLMTELSLTTQPET